MNINNDVPFAAQVKRCGTCHFGKIMPQDFTRRICWGAPPQALNMPAMGQDGRVTVQFVRPIVGVGEDACGMYEPKVIADVEREAAAMTQFHKMMEQQRQREQENGPQEPAVQPPETPQ
jgi:hypothetical protein